MQWPIDLCHVRDRMDLGKKTTISIKDVGNLLNSSFPALSDRIILRFPARAHDENKEQQDGKIYIVLWMYYPFFVSVLLYQFVFLVSQKLSWKNYGTYC